MRPGTSPRQPLPPPLPLPLLLLLLLLCYGAQPRAVGGIEARNSVGWGKP